MLEALSENVEGNITPRLINLCHYITKYCEDEFVSPAGGSGLTFSGSMSAIKTASMNNVIGINVSQLRILLRILQHKISAKLFESETQMIDWFGEMIAPQFDNYKYVHEVGSKPELILYLVRDFIAIFNKGITLLIKSNQLIVNKISSIGVILGSDHSQGVLRFPMKLLFVMKSEPNCWAYK